MKDLTAIGAVYVEIDTILEAMRGLALDTSDAVKAKQIEAKQTLNDQAYFILGWGQMETAINQTCRSAIRRRRASIDRNTRRAWELYNPDDRRLSGLSFEDRAALVLDRQADRPGDVVKAIRDFFTIQSALET